MADSSVELLQPVASVEVAPHASGDADALTLAIFDRHATSLLRYVKSCGLGADESEDVVQDAFLALFKHLSLGRDQTNLTGWLFRVARNLALKRRRTLERRPPHCSWDEPLARAHADARPTPELQVMHRERSRRLWAVVSSLPDRDRRCILLRAEGLTYREIARTVGASLGGVAKSITRVMIRLLAVAEGDVDA